MGKEINVYAVIMAGGVGSRFWPKSRERSPKQLMEIEGGRTMIQNTVDRLKGFVPEKNIFVVTNKLQKHAIIKQLSALPVENIIVEPIGRNTAPCIGLAAMFVRRLDPKGVMVVLPADHIIHNEEEFLRVLDVGVGIAHKEESLITIGIQPTHPETGYGYIQVVEEEHSKNGRLPAGVFRVKTFAEKPNIATAQKFVESGDFYWNSGMFMWRADVILHEIKRSLPELHGQLMEIEPSLGTPLLEQSIEHAYGMIRGISIDYGVMEKAKSVYVIRGEFGWSDVGSWDEVYRLSVKDDQGNHLHGKVVSFESRNSYIHTDDKLVAAVGVDDLIIINTHDALLVCKRGSSQDVKEIVDHLRRKQMNEYL
ncbi:MAG TPA: mannose-1-phosphate guanylyltransferase [Bacteroidota bacterium]|nr:mannose-1-phosphate guanylyltransferase [Bacteroidota bacterium]